MKIGMHEYLRETLIHRYTKCESCTNRTEFICLKFGFCWSCHWKKEHAEKSGSYNSQVLSSASVPPFLVNYSQSSVEEKRKLLHPLIYHPTTERAEPIATTLDVITSFQYRGLEIVSVYVSMHRISL